MTRQRAAVVLALVGLAAAGCTGSSSSPETSPTSAASTSASSPAGSGSTSAAKSPQPPSVYKTPPAHLPAWDVDLSTGPAPWPAPALVNGGADSEAYVAAAGLPYGEETTKVHYHAHLDVIVDGDPVKVPPYIGFVAKDGKALGLSALHIHDESGVVHIENANPATFTLGQVFIEWGVRFTKDCLGSYCTGNGKELAVFVNGKRVTGDPTQLVLASHQEIAVVYGDAGNLPTPPSSYDFPSGE